MLKDKYGEGGDIRCFFVVVVDGRRVPSLWGGGGGGGGGYISKPTRAS